MVADWIAVFYSCVCKVRAKLVTFWEVGRAAFDAKLEPQVGARVRWHVNQPVSNHAHFLLRSLVVLLETNDVYICQTNQPHSDSLPRNYVPPQINFCTN